MWLAVSRININPQFYDGGLLTRVVNEVILYVMGWAAKGKINVGWDVHHSNLLHCRNNLLKYRRGVDVLERDSFRNRIVVRRTRQIFTFQKRDTIGRSTLYPCYSCGGRHAASAHLTLPDEYNRCDGN